MFYTQAGTEDGYVCLFNVNENRVLYDKSLAKQEGTCYNAIMLNWGNSDKASQMRFIEYDLLLLISGILLCKSQICP